METARNISTTGLLDEPVSSDTVAGSFSAAINPKRDTIDVVQSSQEVESAASSEVRKTGTKTGSAAGSKRCSTNITFPP